MAAATWTWGRREGRGWGSRKMRRETRRFSATGALAWKARMRKEVLMSAHSSVHYHHLRAATHQHREALVTVVSAVVHCVVMTLHDVRQRVLKPA
ncbi:hypothetical protein IG631_17733 [Alternaria alternata]|nr:hypothetical protein IG631_17733 [Alternaria alternata]